MHMKVAFIVLLMIGAMDYVGLNAKKQCMMIGTAQKSSQDIIYDGALD